MDLMIDQFCQSYPIAGSRVLISSLKVTVIAFPRFCPQVGATGDIRSAKPTNTASPIHLCLICSPPARFSISTNPLTLCPSPSSACEVENRQITLPPSPFIPLPPGRGGYG